MKKLFIIPFLVFMSVCTKSQSLKNTSYKNDNGEKVLRLEISLPVNLPAAWKLFTIDSQLQKWIAPLAHIDLKTGGYIITNYDAKKILTDSSSIKLPIVSFLKEELLILKVVLNNYFSKTVREQGEHLQEIIQFKKLDENNTLIISSMVGWGTGNEWDKTYDFFVMGNEYTYKELLKNYKK